MGVVKQDAKQIFLGALDCATAEELCAYLAEACGGDGELRARIEQLLAARREAGDFLGGDATDHGEESEQFAEAAGTIIGAYKLVQPIGEGGFGVVYTAEQQRPVRRLVALKVVKPGMDTREVIARFEAERQALAMMDHSNIAKVFDAGTTAQGRPFFVMELVHGIEITEYCNQCRLTMEERLKLFVSVCNAVQHAHQKGIIHRDIKPTNVLVAIEDGRPAPKIIDFGIAKALGRRLGESTCVTNYAQMVGTPLYMSPEQAEMSPLGVDTRSDIYSLGVLLYELVTGRTPIDRQRIRAASHDELRRILQVEEPPPPSVRLSTLSAEEADTVAEQHRVDSRRIVQMVRGELDWIAMKCLEKDRTRRYETAHELARDVERFLADEPVAACPPSTVYRFRKFAQRNKGALLAASAAGLALLVLLVGLLVSNRMIAAESARAEEQRKLALQIARDERKANEVAQAEAAKASAVASLMRDMLAAAHPDSASGNNLKVRDLLDKFSAGMDDRLIDQPEVESTLREIIGSVYTRLGLLDQAEPQLRRSLELSERLFGDDDVRTANAQRHLAWNALERDRSNPEVEAMARQALQVYSSQGDGDGALHAKWLLMLSLDGQSRALEAEQVADEALQFAKDEQLEDHSALPNMLHHLAWINIRKGDYAAAERLARESVKAHERIHGKAHPETAFGWTYLGAALHRQQKFAAAEECYRNALQIFYRSLPANHSYIRPTRVDLLAALRSQGKTAEMIEELREAVRRQPDDALAHNDLAWQLCMCPETQFQDPEAALEAAKRAIVLAPKNGVVWNTLGVAQYRAGRWGDAVESLGNSIKYRQGGDANDWLFLAMAEWQLGNEDAARQWYRKSSKSIEAGGANHEELQAIEAEARALIDLDDGPKLERKELRNLRSRE